MAATCFARERHDWVLVVTVCYWMEERLDKFENIDAFLIAGLDTLQWLINWAFK